MGTLTKEYLKCSSFIRLISALKPLKPNWRDVMMLTMERISLH